jgi:hypothetical protein
MKRASNQYISNNIVSKDNEKVADKGDKSAETVKCK